MSGSPRSPSTPRGREPADAARIKRSAWILAALAIAFYLGFIAWNLVSSTAGG
jgi:hypothetical protein